MTDDTAKAILRGEEYDPDDVLRFYTGEGSEFIVVDLADLQAMARLWLMRDEIIADYEMLARSLPFPTEKDGRHTLAKITAIAGGEDGDDRDR